MSFEPQKFFVGLVDFFSVLMPGGLLAYLGKDWAAQALFCQSSYELEGGEAWMVFLFASYLLGHFVFLFGALLDLPYDRLRKCTILGQIERLAKGKSLSWRGWRWLARKAFGKHADSAVTQAVRLKTRALQCVSAADAINAFQWCKARLSQDHSEALTTVQRFEADSKFFRSFSMVLAGLALFLVWPHPSAALVCAGGLMLALWRYVDQRFKATQQAYWFILTFASKDPSSTMGAAQLIPREDGVTHAGGVVYRKREKTIEYLLVQANRNRVQWVLPKGHIEPGEEPRATAVREVNEETGYWARVVRWIDTVDFEINATVISSQMYLMEYVDAAKVTVDKMTKHLVEDWPPENRQHVWLEFGEAKQKSTFEETKRLLNLADEWRRKIAQQ